MEVRTDMVDSLLGLTGQSVLVIGAGPGMGEACCEVASAAGARVAALDFDPLRVEPVAARIRDRGGDAFAVTANVLDDDELVRAIADVDDRMGGIDADVANGAIFLLSDMAAMVTGHTLAVDGGYLSPGPYDYRRFAPPTGTKRSAYRDLDPS
ncbi:SDR family oxidoreductase [Microbacterium sp. zg.B48]|uniref:SDR family oxidoreductase n=1 Tax=Microbacterium sp. zg.B48 TaxID=2969408 RepID=UPI00214CDA7B|nr:SDR family oxidoreductase [Microbacterium sp. zg.B48]MCR2764339.1 SDR family oxidoreductase [Microbacterium sp. zg.B48]